MTEKVIVRLKDDQPDAMVAGPSYSVYLRRGLEISVDKRLYENVLKPLVDLVAPVSSEKRVRKIRKMISEM